MIVTHYRNKTLYNKVFFGTFFMHMIIISRIHRIHPHFNKCQIASYDIKYSAVNYFAILHTVRYRINKLFLSLNYVKSNKLKKVF